MDKIAFIFVYNRIIINKVYLKSMLLDIRSSKPLTQIYWNPVYLMDQWIWESAKSLVTLYVHTRDISEMFTALFPNIYVLAQQTTFNFFAGISI